MMSLVLRLSGTCGNSLARRCRAPTRSSGLLPKNTSARLRCDAGITRCETPGKAHFWRITFGVAKGVKKRAFLTLAFASPLSILKRNDVDQIDETLNNIPKEVFKKDVFKKTNRSSIGRIFFHFLYNIKLGIRFIHLSCVYFPILTSYPFACISGATKRAWWKLLLFACEHTGPTFIKLGQWASTRRDLFDEEFCLIFSKLHNQTQHHSWFYTKQKLRKAFGKNWKKIFARVDRKPCGSGCVAQVHKGYMHINMVPDETIIEDMSEDDDTEFIDFAEGMEITGFSRAIDAVDGDSGDYEPQKSLKSEEDSEQPAPPDQDDIIPVAIKVLHPGIYRSVSRDLKIMRVMARVLEMAIPSLRWLSISECLQEFGQTMTKQIDLRYEATCLERFVDNFESIPSVRFPRPVRPFCKRDALVETWEEGVPIEKFIRESDDELNSVELKEALASIGIDAILQMVFTDNFVHGDLHPGNIFVQNSEYFTQTDENKIMLVDVGDTMIVGVNQPAENPLRLVMLDTGISVALSERDRGNFRSVFSAVVLGEGETVAELMLDHSTYNDCKDVDGFKTELGALVNTFRTEALSLSKVEVGSLLTQVFSILAKHKVKMESNFASVILAIFVLEGLGRSLDPNVDLLTRAKPVLLHGKTA